MSFSPSSKRLKMYFGQSRSHVSGVAVGLSLRKLTAEGFAHSVIIELFGTMLRMADQKFQNENWWTSNLGLEGFWMNLR